MIVCIDAVSHTSETKLHLRFSMSLFNLVVPFASSLLKDTVAVDKSPG